MRRINTNIHIKGYDLLGTDGSDGVRYAWECGDGKGVLLESAAFPQKTKGVQDSISGYTTSVSRGCILRPLGYHCRFCRTGMTIPFSGFLTAFDIAKQNILMVLTDMNCSDKTFLRTNAREFAYMGQGEPGYSYPQVRTAIKITDIVMQKLEQTVYRHIVATSGIPEMIEAYKNDMMSRTFESRVTMHFSLHAADRRNIIMPINNMYPFEISLAALSDIHKITGEKPCVGIIMFKNFTPSGCLEAYSNDIRILSEIAKMLDPAAVRVSLCEFNESSDLGTVDFYTEAECESMLNVFIENGFEVKLFSSFGKQESTACGMLGGTQPAKLVGKKWLQLDAYADELIEYAVNQIWR